MFQILNGSIFFPTVFTFNTQLKYIILVINDKVNYNKVIVVVEPSEIISKILFIK